MEDLEQMLVRLITFLVLLTSSLNAQTLLHHETFGTPGLCAYDTGFWTPVASGFTDANYTPTTSATKYVTTPASPGGGCAMNSFIPIGTNETIPARVQKDQVYTERYVEFYIYFKSPYFYPGGLKLARFGANSGTGSTAFFEYNYNSGSPGIVFYTYDGPSATAHYVGNISYTFPEDTWIKIGLHFRDSTPSVANGFYRLYINDVMTINSGSIITRTTSESKDYIWIGGNNSWGAGTGEGGGTTASGNSALYFDDVKIFDAFSSSSPTPTPSASSSPTASASSGPSATPSSVGDFNKRNPWYNIFW